MKIKTIKNIKESGITLIALVITIVVLIILAAVAINLSLGSNGIFNRARTAKEQYTNAQGYEQTEMPKLVNSIDGNINKDIVGTRYSDEEINSKFTWKLWDPSNTGSYTAIGGSEVSLPQNYTELKATVIDNENRHYNILITKADVENETGIFAVRNRYKL